MATQLMLNYDDVPEPVYESDGDGITGDLEGSMNLFHYLFDKEALMSYETEVAKANARDLERTKDILKNAIECNELYSDLENLDENQLKERIAKEAKNARDSY